MWVSKKDGSVYETEDCARYVAELEMNFSDYAEKISLMLSYEDLLKIILDECRDSLDVETNEAIYLYFKENFEEIKKEEE